MDVIDTPDDARPRPNPDATSQPFWAAASRGDLQIQHCPSCGAWQHYPRAICLQCGSTPEYRSASGRGTVHTFTIIRQNGARPFRDELPYVVAMIELAEGAQMMGNVTDCDPETVAIGMEVEAYALRVGDEVGIVQWRPAR